jgi:hypothetical protein
MVDVDHVVGPPYSPLSLPVPNSTNAAHGAVAIRLGKPATAPVPPISAGTRGGRDTIDHVKGAHDDVANAVAGALVTAYIEPGVNNFNRRIDYRPIGLV